jgi:hypothetical protein
VEELGGGGKDEDLVGPGLVEEANLDVARGEAEGGGLGLEDDGGVGVEGDGDDGASCAALAGCGDEGAVAPVNAVEVADGDGGPGGAGGERSEGVEAFAGHGDG